MLQSMKQWLSIFWRIKLPYVSSSLIFNVKNICLYVYDWNVVSKSVTIDKKRAPGTFPSNS